MLGRPATAVQPGDGSFDDPTAWEHHKLIATSEAQAIGTQWWQLSARVRRRRPGSRGKRRACIARDHSINHAVKQLPWQRLSAIGFEDLSGLKRGKSRRRGKNFRIAAAPWKHRRGEAPGGNSGPVQHWSSLVW